MEINSGVQEKAMCAKVPDTTVRYGDIFHNVSLDGIGSEQTGDRPCIVVSNNACNTYSPVVTVVPLSTQKKQSLPTHVLLVSKTSGLPKTSIALCEQVRSIDKVRLGEKIGYIPRSEMRGLSDALKVQLNLLG